MTRTEGSSNRAVLLDCTFCCSWLRNPLKALKKNQNCQIYTPGILKLANTKVILHLSITWAAKQFMLHPKYILGAGRKRERLALRLPHEEEVLFSLYELGWRISLSLPCCLIRVQVGLDVVTGPRTTSVYLLITSSTNMKSSYLKFDRSVPRRYVFTFSWTSYKKQTFQNYLMNPQKIYMQNMRFCMLNTLKTLR